MTSDSWAVQFHRYGDPDVLIRDTVPAEHAGVGQVRVRVAAVGVNRIDLVVRAGILRTQGFGFPKGTGFDVVGIVDEVGAGIGDTVVGAVVWGCLGLEPLRRRGTLSEFVILTCEQYAVLPTRDLDPGLAALPLAALTALACLRDSLRVLPGDRVLIVGAGGGVGTAAIQIAGILGAVPVAICGQSNMAPCRDLGAQEVYDYAQTRPSDIPGQFAAVLDTAGVDTTAYQSALDRSGRIVCTAADAWLRMLPRALMREPRIRLLSAGPSRRDLAWLATQVGEGRLRPVVDRMYGIDEIRQAHEDSSGPHAAGRRIVVVD